MAPLRIQRRRSSGWRMPTSAVYVGRPTRWGNPFDWRICGRAEAVRLFEAHLTGSPELLREARSALAGKHLACWCRVGEPCHADVLLRVVNDPSSGR
jgi:hypothetical protein